MARSNADLLAIKDELTNDPLSLGLTTLAADDVANANKLNEIRSTISVRRRWMGTAELLAAIKPLEHQALTTQQARYLDSVLTLQQLDPFAQSELIDGVRDMFVEGLSESHGRISAAVVQDGNRMEDLYQSGLITQGGNITPSDVANARNAT